MKNMKSVTISMKRDRLATLHMVHTDDAKLMKRVAENMVTSMPCRVFMALCAPGVWRARRGGKEGAKIQYCRACATPQRDHSSTAAMPLRARKAIRDCHRICIT